MATSLVWTMSKCLWWFIIDVELAEDDPGAPDSQPISIDLNLMAVHSRITCRLSASARIGTTSAAEERGNEHGSWGSEQYLSTIADFVDTGQPPRQEYKHRPSFNAWSVRQCTVSAFSFTLFILTA